jgi:hypothetical protein
VTINGVCICNGIYLFIWLLQLATWSNHNSLRINTVCNSLSHALSLLSLLSLQSCPLVTASNGRRFTSSGFPKCLRASATGILGEHFNNYHFPENRSRLHLYTSLKKAVSSQIWLMWTHSKPKQTAVQSRSRSYFTTDDQSVSQSLCLGVEPTLELVARYYFLSERWCLKIAVLSLWSALSDERTGLQFAMQSLNGPGRSEPVTILCCLIWDSPNLEARVPVFIFPRNWVAQLHPRALAVSN